MVNQILELLEQNPNISNRDMGKILGKSNGCIQYYLNKLGIHRNRKIQQKLNNTNRNKPIYIDNIAEQIILGSILGDGCIEKYNLHPENTKLLLNSRLTFSHCERQLEYLKYKQNLLKEHNIKSKVVKKLFNSKIRYIKGNLLVESTSYSLKTMRNVSFNNYRNLFYKDKKYINRYIYKLNPLGLAIWFMDDGSYFNNSFKLYTNCFTLNDDILLLKMLKHNFNIDATLQKTSNIGYQIYIKSKSRERFKNLIRPYIVDCMKYKIGS